MKKTYLSIVLFIVLSISAHPGIAKDSKLTKGELFKIYSEKLVELKLPTVDLSRVQIADFSTEEDLDSYDRKVILASCKGARFRIEIDPYTGKIYACQNYTILDLTQSKGSPLFEGGSQPFKKKEDIIKEGEHYLKILNNGKIPGKLKIREVKYTNSSWLDSKHSFMGDWSIWWDQMEGPYTLGSMVVFVNEKYGLSDYGDNRYLTYYPPKEIRITKEKAIEMANKDINKIILEGFRVEGTPKAVLTITNQNIYAQKLSSNFIKRPKSYARLAWAVMFRCVSDVKFENGSSLAPSSHTIYYDAETGEALGAIRQM